ncbi:MAG: sigma-70 family RNA polymerase sigma factor [Gemmatales bacterium]
MNPTAPSSTARLAGYILRWRHDTLVGTLTDAELLRRFVAQRDEQAFAQMVCRHGPMVLRTCRRIVGQAHDADDAFQATFMVLARRAGAIQPPGMLGAWLHGVACRCAQALRHKLARQRGRELPLEESPPVEVPATEVLDWLPYLDHEIQRLPKVYRKAVVLCELEGRSRKEVALLLGVAEGTLSSRLATARKRLAKRLVRRGLASGLVLGSWMAMNSTATAALPETVVQSTTEMAMKLLHSSAALSLSPSIYSLTQGAMNSMFITKCKVLAFVAVASGCLGWGCWLIGEAAAHDAPVSHALLSPVIAAPSVPTSEPIADDDDHDKKHDKKHQDHKDKAKTPQETITGSGKLKTESRPVDHFTSIQLQNAGKLTIKQTGKEKLTIKTDDNLLPLLKTEVENNVLVLTNAKDNVNLKPSKDNEYTIEVKALSKLDVNGAGTIIVQDLDGKEMKVAVNGAGTVTLEGSASNLQITINGAGTVHADQLKADNATVNIPGSGTVTVHAKETLKATILGTGSIQYQGDPKVTKTIRGAGSVKKLATGTR